MQNGHSSKVFCFFLFIIFCRKIEQVYKLGARLVLSTTERHFVAEFWVWFGIWASVV